MKERNFNIDIMRIVAALMVLTVHVGYEFAWISDYTWYGYYGTSLFFVISGYLSMTSMEKCASVGEFYKKRVLRIIPLYWVVLLVTMLLNRQLFNIKFLRYFFFLHMFIPSDDFSAWNNINGLWTMSAFMLFYIIVPYIYKLVRKYYVGLVILIVMLFRHDAFVAWFEQFVLKISPEMSESYNFAAWHPFSVMYAFMGGVVVYLALKERHQFGFAVLCMLSMVYNQFLWHAWDIVMMLLLVCAVSAPNLVEPDGKMGKIVRVFSDFSFPLYLTHILVLQKIMPLQDALVPYIRHKGFLMFVLAVCILCGYLSWRYIEKPLVGLIKKYTDKPY